MGFGWEPWISAVGFGISSYGNHGSQGLTKESIYISEPKLTLFPTSQIIGLPKPNGERPPGLAACDTSSTSHDDSKMVSGPVTPKTPEAHYEVQLPLLLVRLQSKSLRDVPTPTVRKSNKLFSGS